MTMTMTMMIPSSSSPSPKIPLVDPESQPLLLSTTTTRYDVGEQDHIQGHEQSPLLIPSSPTTTTTNGKDEDGVVVNMTRWTIVYWGFIFLFIVFIAIVVIKAVSSSSGGADDDDDVPFPWGKVWKSALGGGLAGAAAMILQVLTLMPLRTIMNYQYRFGTSTTIATITLYQDGGWKRYYNGLTAALIQAPVSRFGDTAANTGILTLMESNPFLKTLPKPIQTIFVSLVSASFRILLTPIDTVKTTLQAQGSQLGWGILKTRIQMYGITSLWYGALAAAVATFVGNYPWFAIYNWLRDVLPPGQTTFHSLCRQAFVGFCASVVSDTVSNWIRVVKTYRQVNDTRIGYSQAAREVIRTDGLKGLFGRGLKTRIISNGMQGLMFSVLWKLFLDLWNDKTT